MTSKEKRKWAKKLTPYWKSWKQMHDEWRKNERILEGLMEKELGEKLEFIYGEMDMGCSGIGHSDYSRRNSKEKGYFPLFQAESLGGYL